MTDNSPSGRRALVVEDDGLLAMHINDILDDLGYSVIGPFRAIGPALEAIRGGRIDMALLDINLGMEGTSYPVARALAAQGVPFAFLSGYGEAGLVTEFRDRPIISKPVEERLLADVLRQLQKPTPTTL